MDMNVVMLPSRPSVDFNFDSACTSPYVSAPSSPQRFGSYFFSAPASPARISASSNSYDIDDESLTLLEGGNDFAFDFSGQLERPSLSADELFDGGIIKPLKPPPQSEVKDTKLSDCNEDKFSDAIQQTCGGHVIKDQREKFSEAIQQTCGGHCIEDRPEKFSVAIQQTRGAQLINDQRGRERANTSARHKSTRSVSPLRVSDLLFEREVNRERQNLKESCSSPSPVPGSSNFSTWYSKWNLKEFLFRSKSEGSAPRNKDPLKKYRRESEDVKHSSFRSTDSSSVGSSLRRKGSISAHELHYTVNRAASEEMRKKTFLPYRQGWLGCLGFSPGTNFGSSMLTRQYQ